MGRAQLKALLSSGSSIVFDARARELQPGSSPKAEGTVGDTDMLPPFFEHKLLKNVLLLKSVERSVGDDLDSAAPRTRLYVPFDGGRIEKGGKSLPCTKDITLATLENFFGVEKIERTRIETDLSKILVLAKTPSFSPFLLRDAFERAGITVDKRFFQISDAEADALREVLKTKLKPLAAMALNLSATLVGNAQLDLLARKLWELDDPRFLTPLGRALKIADTETIDVFYAWIGVAYFQREFGKRQVKLRQLAEGLVAKPPFPDGTKEEVVREYEEDRRQVRDRVRWAWSTAGSAFERYTKSYDALIAGGGNARPFVEYLQNVRTDFSALGARLSVVEQCLSLYDVTMSQERGSIMSSELLRDVARSMREMGGDGDSGRAAA